MNKYITLLLFAFLLNVGSSFASDESVLINEADKEYKSCQYGSAIDKYTEVAAKYGFSSELFYNCGNAYYKMGDKGNAILCYEKALILDSHNEKALNNRDFLEAKVRANNEALAAGTNYEPIPENPSIWHTFGNYLIGVGVNTWSILALVFFVLTAAFIAVYYFMHSVLVKKIGFFGSICSFICVCVFISFSLMSKSNLSSCEMAVIVSREVELHQSPNIAAKAIATKLTSGTKVTVMDEELDKAKQKWFKIYLNSDYCGWVDSKDVKLISLDADI